MTRCSTWHIRVDMVEDRGQVTARARLVGAPTAMARPDTSQDAGDADDLTELLATWRPIEELGPILASALSAQNGLEPEGMPLPDQQSSGAMA